MADNTNVLLMGQSALSELLSEYGSTELPLNADASQVISEGVSALNTLKSKYSSTTLTINAKVNSSGTGTTGTDTGGGGGKVTLQQRAMGGRFTERTLAEIAEDGDPEYVIPGFNSFSLFAYLSLFTSHNTKIVVITIAAITAHVSGK